MIIRDEESPRLCAAIMKGSSAWRKSVRCSD